MAHLYSTHRVGPRIASSTRRRNFGSDDVLLEEEKKKNDLEFEINFGKRYGHYFDSRDIKKFSHLLKTDPIKFENKLNTDPEIRIRMEAAAQKETKKQELILKGQEQLKKWSEQYRSENFVTDEDNIQHFKPNDIDNINSFNDEFSRYSRTVADYIDQVEKTQVSDHRNSIIYNRNKRKEEVVGFSKQRFEDTLYGYKKEEVKIKKKLNQLSQNSSLPTLTQDQPLTKQLEFNQLKQEIIQDIISPSIDNDFMQTRWFEQRKNNLDSWNLKYEIKKYEEGIFRYTHHYKNHKVVFQPSGGGKSTLDNTFSTYVFDVDKLLDYERDENKFKYLLGYSKFFNKWNIVNNYWKEMINMYEYKFRGKILLCHGPDQLPIGFLNDARAQSLIILPSVKRWDVRSFKDNFDYLKNLETDVIKVSLHYRYYFYIMYNFFKLEINSWQNIKIN